MIARVLRELGYVEQWGTGIGRMEKACFDAGLPAPRFEELGGRFRVTILTNRDAVPVLDDVDQQIVDSIPEEGTTTAKVAEAIGKSVRTARMRLQKLVDRGAIVEIGSSWGVV